MDLESYRRRAEERLDKTQSGFGGHLATFVAVNGGLAGIWLASGGGFPWFLIPLFAWGIGLAANFDEVLRKRKEVAEISRMEHATEQQLETHKKLAKARARWRSHLVSNSATIALLFVINMTTSPRVPWFLFPAGAMGIGLASHFARYRGQVKRLRRELGSPVPSVQLQNEPQESGTLATAARLKAEIVAEAAEGTAFEQGEIASLLEDYLQQLASLEQQRRRLSELERTLEAAKARDRVTELEERLAVLENEGHRQEYEASIAQLKKQLDLDAELRREAELIDLRLDSALSGLRQIRVALARSKDRPSSAPSTSVEDLRRRSEELQHYLQDLRQAYENLKP